ncbi:MAG: dipeptide/oligopeptide/nickel ABC transporter permease/ATP-binding protein [Desulfatibacillum sp.]|nr:dipeptide/oligopeptide/nickel ABC transporter permease/ATP-binding protein [Desulfatibacillum sp.]
MGTKQQKIHILVGACLLCLLIAVLLPALTAPQGMRDLGAPYLLPGPGHVLGTNDIGQDILSELIFGARASLLVGLLSALIATAMGSLTGALAGYFRRTTDAILMGLADMFLAIPGLPLVIVLAALLGPGMGNIILVISILSWAPTARIVRSRVLSLREADFVVNARCLGGGHLYLIFRHILPNTGDLILAKAILAVAGGMMAEAGLSFLGLGDPVCKSWGGMIHDAFSCGALTNGAYWWYGPPIFCLSFSVLCFSLLGNYLLKASRETRMSTTCYYGDKKRNKHTIERAKKNSQSPTLPILQLNNLSLKFPQSDGSIVPALDNVNLSVMPGEKVALLGLSGSGKSLLLLSVLGIRLPGGESAGEVLVNGKYVENMTAHDLEMLRKKTVAFVPQGTGNALNPIMRIGRQIRERIMQGENAGEEVIVGLLAQTGFENPVEVAANYPHRLSGGMKERVLAALALASPASLLLADEPTKALDSRSCQDVTRMYASMQSRTMVAVTHDLNFARAIADRVVVMHQGCIVEDAPANVFFQRPQHPFSRALLNAVPGPDWKLGIFSRGSTPCCDHGEACSLIGDYPVAEARRQQSPPLKNAGDRYKRVW